MLENGRILEEYPEIADDVVYERGILSRLRSVFNQKFALDRFNDKACLAYFRFTKAQIRELIEELELDPNSMERKDVVDEGYLKELRMLYKRKEYRSDPEEMISLTLARLSSSYVNCNFLEFLFLRKSQQLSSMFNAFASFIFKKYESVIMFNETLLNEKYSKLYNEKIEEKSKLFSQKSADEILLDFEENLKEEVGYEDQERMNMFIPRVDSPNGVQGVVGFIYGSVIDTRTPAEKLTSRSKNLNGLKFQGVYLPNGYIAVMSEAATVKIGKLKLLKNPKLEEKLEKLLTTEGSDDTSIDKESYCLLDDRGYHAESNVVKRLEREDDQQHGMRSKTTEEIITGLTDVYECAFGLMSQQFGSVLFGNLRASYRDMSLALYLSVFFTNIKNSYSPNHISQFFQLKPQGLDEYLSGAQKVQ